MGSCSFAFPVRGTDQYSCRICVLYKISLRSYTDQGISSPKSFIDRLFIIPRFIKRSCCCCCLNSALTFTTLPIQEGARIGLSTPHRLPFRPSSPRPAPKSSDWQDHAFHHLPHTPIQAILAKIRAFIIRPLFSASYGTSSLITIP